MLNAYYFNARSERKDGIKLMIQSGVANPVLLGAAAITRRLRLMASFGDILEIIGMASSSQRLSRLLEALFGQLAIRAGNDKLIYQDILCMSWATVLDTRDLLDSEASSKPTYAELAPAETAVVLKRELNVAVLTQEKRDTGSSGEMARRSHIADH